MGVTPKGIPIPDLDDPANAPLDFLGVSAWLENYLSPLTYAQINALSGVDLWVGRKVYQTDTGTNRPNIGEYTWNGVSWRLPWNQPWGLVKRQGMAPSGTSYSSIAPATALGCTFAAVANRLYTVKCRIPFQVTAANAALSRLVVTEGPVQITEAVFPGDEQNSPGLGQVVLDADELTFDVGSQTITPWLGRGSGDGSVSVIITSSSLKPAFVSVFDTGPVPGGSPT